MCILVSSMGKTVQNILMYISNASFQSRGSVHYTCRGKVVPPNLDLSGSLYITFYVANNHVHTNRHSVSFAHVAHYLFIQGEGKTVVEEEELTMRKKSVQQCVHSITFQQHLKITAKSAKKKRVASNNQ